MQTSDGGCFALGQAASPTRCYMPLELKGEIEVWDLRGFKCVWMKTCHKVLPLQETWVQTRSMYLPVSSPFQQGWRHDSMHLKSGFDRETGFHVAANDPHTSPSPSVSLFFYLKLREAQQRGFMFILSVHRIRFSIIDAQLSDALEPFWRSFAVWGWLIIESYRTTTRQALPSRNSVLMETFLLSCHDKGRRWGARKSSAEPYIPKRKGIFILLSWFRQATRIDL